MFIRVSRILVLIAIAGLLIDVRASLCQAWSLLHPFTSDAKPQPKPGGEPVEKPPRRGKSSPPGRRTSVARWGDGGAEEGPPKKPQYAIPKAPATREPPKSWLARCSSRSSHRRRNPQARFIGGQRPESNRMTEIHARPRTGGVRCLAGLPAGGGHTCWPAADLLRAERTAPAEVSQRIPCPPAPPLDLND